MQVQKLLLSRRWLLQVRTSRHKSEEAGLVQYFMGSLSMAKRWLSKSLKASLTKDQPSFLMRFVNIDISRTHK